MAQLSSALGAAGARWFLETLGVQPIHAYATAPVITYLSAERGPGEPLIDEATMAALLEDPRVLGLGEVYWHRLLPEPDRLLPLIDRARALGKTVEGHAAGARGPRLVACAGAGLDSCHEPITAGEALERLRLGMRVLIREGSVRRDLEAVLAVRHTGASLRRVTLASDGIWPQDLLERGYMDGIVQRAIDLGLPPVTAYQMASLHGAEHFGLDRELGGIAPGRWADLLVLPDLRTVRPEIVVARGQIVARDGRCLVPCPDACPCPRASTTGPGRGRSIRPPCDSPRRARGPTVRVIRVAGDIVTVETAATLPVRDGAVLAEPASDLLLAVVCDRRRGRERGFGVVQGFGLRRGRRRLHALLRYRRPGPGRRLPRGARRRRPAGRGAPRRLRRGRRARRRAGGGGLADRRGCRAGARAGARARARGDVETALRALGCGLARPLLTLQTLTFTAIPALRLTTRGLLDVKSRQHVPALL